MDIFKDSGLFQFMTGEQFELGDIVTFTIKDVKTVAVDDEKDGEVKPAVYFTESDQALVLNKTNARRLAKLFGRDTNLWIGERVNLYSETISAFGSDKDVIRVHPRKPEPAKAKA